MKRSKIWLGVGVALVAGATPSAAESNPRALLDGTSLTSPDATPQWQQRDRVQFAQAAPQGQGGENEGGEAGVDAEAADKDAVKYNIALQVIAAHFQAGFAVYQGNEQQAGTEMFAHGHSEIFAVLEDVFKKRGVTGLGTKIEAAIAAAARKAPSAEVKKAVDDVLEAIAQAERAAPKSPLSPLALKAQVIADMLDRAASQYAVALKDPKLEPYLDGLGFALVARSEYGKIRGELEKADPAAAKAIASALQLAERAYPGIKRPGGQPVQNAAFLASASAARIAAAKLK